METRSRMLLPLVVTWLALGVAACAGGEEPMLVGDLLADPVHDEVVVVRGTVSLLGELFCPCFELSSGGGTVMVWYDLMTDGEESSPAVDVSAIANGDTATVEGELRRSAAEAGVPPEMWAASIDRVEG